MYTDYNMAGNLPPEPLTGSRRPWRSGLWMIAMALLLFGALAFFQRDRDDRDPAVAQSAPPAAGPDCRTGQDFDVSGASTDHVDTRVDYESSPPHSGKHHPSPLGVPGQLVARDAAPENVVERAVHNLEHGYVVVWYDDRAGDSQVEAVAAAARETGLRKIVVVPWSRTTFDGTPFVLSAWGHLQACVQPDASVLRAFWNAHGGENGEAPEKTAP